MRRIWVCGANGRVGNALQYYFDPMDIELLLTDKEEVDVTDSEEVTLFAERLRPFAIINCAGFTDPVACEKDPDRAYAVNGLGARNVAIASQTVNAKLVHLSTDDVFNGFANTPYREYDMVDPQTIYGKSKKFGEDFVRGFCHKHFIIRTSWLYSPINRRVEEIIEQAKKGETIYMPKNKTASPTSVYELAQFISQIIESYDYGTFHASCQGKASRKEWAEKILELANVRGKVEMVEKDERSIYRPDYTVLDNYILRISGLYDFPSWEKALKGYIKNEGLVNHG
ncbi:MAG: NAD(P)-dependent oxidoreductase [Tissierellia bacterium]|nr:NAD(P)-dependent oxidoreductase [Tissierellia bacterium]